MRSTPGPVRDERGRHWVNSQTDGWAEAWLARELTADGVTVVEPPKPVCVTGSLDGAALYGEVWGRRWGVAGWEGLVLLEREYAPGWWHLQSRWVPAGRIQVLPVEGEPSRHGMV